MTTEDMKDKEYRHGMVASQIEIDLPLQIRALRLEREWTQPDLAEATGMKQPRISAMEKPGAVHFTLETLRRVAEAFDVALVVRFAPFSELVRWSKDFSPDHFSVPSFDDDVDFIEHKPVASELTMNTVIKATGTYGPSLGRYGNSFVIPSLTGVQHQPMNSGSERSGAATENSAGSMGFTAVGTGTGRLNG